MAQQLYQLSDVQEAFAARVQAKVQDRREQTQDKAEDVPLIGWLLRPLAGWAFDSREHSNTRLGERGEEAVLHSLLRWLPEHWFVFHNVVVEPQPGDFAQIDLLLASTAGVFLIETKAWRGSYKAYRNEWHRREGNTWAGIHSPTAQVQRQSRMLTWWITEQRSLLIPSDIRRCITPIVVFTQPQWLHANQCSVEIFVGASDLIRFLQEQPAGLLATNQVEAICDLIIHSPTPVLREPDAAPAAQLAPRAEPPYRPMKSREQPTPICPKCGVPLVLRTARKGTNSGNQFYGCPNFPRCREIKQVPHSSARQSSGDESRRHS